MHQFSEIATCLTSARPESSINAMCNRVVQDDVVGAKRGEKAAVSKDGAPLARRIFVGLAQKLVLEVLLLFVPVWTLLYWQAWVYLGVTYLALYPIILYFLKYDPEFVRRRLKMGSHAETRESQKTIMALLKWLYMLLLLVPALDHRFGWSDIPAALVVAANVMVLLGMIIQFRVFQENTFASALIELAVDQKVVSTGPYRLVRHPMYSGATLLSFATPVALGSWWGLPIAALKLVVIIARLLDEEQFLTERLAGYRDYCRSVKYRLIPYVW